MSPLLWKPESWPSRLEELEALLRRLDLAPADLAEWTRFSPRNYQRNLARAGSPQAGHLRSYALFIQDSAIADGRYAVETDACESQTYTQFDVATGVLGRPTAPTQPALY